MSIPGHTVFKELNRRGVLRAVAAYIALIWLLAQGVVDVFPAVGLPDWTVRAFLFLSVAATPLVAFLAWRYDLTSKGFLRDKRDIAAARFQAARNSGEITRSTELDADEPVGQVVVSWADENSGENQRSFDSAFLIGRDYGAHVRVADDRVSRRHLRVFPSGGKWWMKDLNSLNGTYKDGCPVETEALENGDETVVALHKDGPRVKLEVRVAEKTQVTVGS